MKASVILLLLALALPQGARAEEACKAGTPPVDCHFTNTLFLTTMCRLKVEIGMMDRSKLEEAGKCFEEAKSASQVTYKKAASALSKNPGAVNALKRHQARFLTTLDSMMPKGGETEREWKRRLNQLEQDLANAANEVRVEM